MGAPDVRLPAEPPLHGRDTTVRALVELARAGEPVLLVAGPVGSGATRVAAEAAAAIARDHGRVVDARGEAGDSAERLQRAVAGSGLVGAARGPAGIVAVLLGDVAPGEDVPAPPAGLARVARAVVIATGTRVRDDLPTVVLHPLEADDGAALARVVAPALDPATAAEVARLADGLPGRIVALSRAARGRPTPDAPLPVPDALADPVRASLAALSDGAQEVARWASILDEPLTMGTLLRLVSAGRPWVERALDELVTSGLLEEPPVVGDPVWRFRERIVRAVIEADLPPSDRRRRHNAALRSGRAAGLARDALIRHAVGAADTDSVATLSIAASAEERAAGNAAAALAHANRAFRWAEASGEAERVLDARVERGIALLDSGEWSEAAEELEVASAGLRAAGREQMGVLALCEASTARWNAGEHDAALALVTAGTAGVATTAASAERGAALVQGATFSNLLGRFSLSGRLAHEAREICLAAGAHEDATRASIIGGMARVAQGLPDGLDQIVRAGREARRGRGRRNETLAAIFESHALVPTGRPGDAAAAARRGIARAIELGIRDHELVLRVNLADALIAQGLLSDAREELDRAVAGWQEMRGDGPLPTDANVAWLALAQGDVDTALVRFQALSGSARLDRTHYEHVASLLTGHALAAQAAGQADEARTVASLALGVWRDTDDQLLALPLLAVTGLVGAPSDAAVAAAALLRAERAGGAACATPFRQLGASRLGGDPPGVGARAAADGFTRLGMRWWAAKSLLVASADVGGPEGAEILLEARRLFDEMDAAGWRARVEAALRAAGVRVSSRGSSDGGHVLTSREMEVLVHLAEGMTNRQIGERLFISERTVARHLIQVFSKLGVSTRTAAVQAAREAGIFHAPVGETAGGAQAAEARFVILEAPGAQG